MTIHHVFANRSNVGDWLSARGVQSLLPPGRVEEHLCDLPFVPGTLERLSEAGPDDLVVIGGGGLFMDYFLPFWEGFAAIVGRAPFVVWGPGYVDLKAEPSRIDAGILLPVLEHARVVAVRDRLTREILADLPDVRIAPCPSALAVPRPDAPGHGVLHAANYTTAGAAAYEAMREAATRFAEETGRTYRETNNRIEAGDETELRSTLERYARSDVVLSSRLHGCIIALAMGRALLAVSGDRKVESFMEASGHGDRVLDAGDLEALPAALRGAAEEGPRDTGFSHRVREANQAVAEEVRRTLGQSLNPAPETP